MLDQVLQIFDIQSDYDLNIMKPVSYTHLWKLNLAKSLYPKEEGQQRWTFMGNNIKPVIVKEGFDVHDEDDIKRTERWLLEEGIKYE